jgi:SAM-dependent methyltransferase
MHASSAKRLERFIQLYAIPWAAKHQGPFTVVDVGAADSGIWYQQYFTKGYPFLENYPGWDKSLWDYKGLDLHGERNVHITVCGAPYNWPIPDSSIDLVISGQAFEHIEYPWLTMQEIARILKPDSLCFIVAPSAGQIHRHPVDCYRYLPDGMLALAKYVNLEVLAFGLKWETEYCGEDASGFADIVLIAKKPC